MKNKTNPTPPQAPESPKTSEWEDRYFQFTFEMEKCKSITEVERIVKRFLKHELDLAREEALQEAIENIKDEKIDETMHRYDREDKWKRNEIRQEIRDQISTSLEKLKK